MMSGCDNEEKITEENEAQVSLEENIIQTESVQESIEEIVTEMAEESTGGILKGVGDTIAIEETGEVFDIQVTLEKCEVVQQEDYEKYGLSIYNGEEKYSDKLVKAEFRILNASEREISINYIENFSVEYDELYSPMILESGTENILLNDSLKSGEEMTGFVVFYMRDGGPEIIIEFWPFEIGMDPKLSFPYTLID